ncbi:PK beta-barrel-protein domain-containing protein-like protein [Apiospora sp. TS-2023a]
MDISVSIKNERTGGGDELHYPAAPLPPKDVLLCVRTGKIRPLGNSGGKLRSAINKQPRAGPVYVGATGLAGDEVQYVLHGGPEKALHQYSASHYAAWNTELPGRESLFQIGGFGENLSTTLLNEEKEDLTARAKRFVFELEDAAAAETNGNAGTTNGKKDDEEDFAQGFAPHVRLRFGPDQRFSRAYSVVSGSLKRFELGVARDDNSRGGSVYLHDSLNVGNIIKVANGHQAKLPSEDNDAEGKDCIKLSGEMKHIYIVGGIGVTAFLRSISQRDPSDNFEVHYAVRSKNDAAYLDRLPKSKTTLYAKDEGQQLNLKTIVPPTVEDIHNTSIYCCGPSSLLAECRQLTQALGYPRSRTYFEEFGGSSLTAGTGDPFEVEIKSTQQILQVPGDKSLLDILNEAGFEIESSCLVGNCGTCMVDYSCNKEGGEEGKRGGEVVHQGFALSDGQKEDSMLSCVSRAKGRITIDC